MTNRNTPKKNFAISLKRSDVGKLSPFFPLKSIKTGIKFAIGINLSIFIVLIDIKPPIYNKNYQLIVRDKPTSLANIKLKPFCFPSNNIP